MIRRIKVSCGGSLLFLISSIITNMIEKIKISLSDGLDKLNYTML